MIIVWMIGNFIKEPIFKYRFQTKPTGISLRLLLRVKASKALLIPGSFVADGMAVFLFCAYPCFSCSCLHTNTLLYSWMY
jgi:hypothetical protein